MPIEIPRNRYGSFEPQIVTKHQTRWAGFDEKILSLYARGMRLRKITKNRGSFPNDDALLKLFYLALANISKKWTMPLRDWKAALTRFTIQFEERMLKL